jgi:hypothetical protein
MFSSVLRSEGLLTVKMNGLLAPGVDVGIINGSEQLGLQILGKQTVSTPLIKEGRPRQTRRELENLREKTHIPNSLLFAIDDLGFEVWDAGVGILVYRLNAVSNGRLLAAGGIERLV